MLVRLSLCEQQAFLRFYIILFKVRNEAAWVSWCDGSQLQKKQMDPNAAAEGILDTFNEAVQPTAFILANWSNVAVARQMGPRTFLRDISFFCNYVMVSTKDSESCHPSSNHRGI